MRDDDDDFDEDPPVGQILHSGIRRESDIEPAEYALPPGMPALEGEPYTSLDLEDEGVAPTNERRWDRRRMIAFAAGGLLFGAGSFLGGSLYSRGPGPASPRDRQSGTRLSREDLRLIEIARGWADKPIDVLVGSSQSFLWVFHHVEPDEQLCHGLKRLCDYALLHRDEKGYKVAVRVLGLFQDVPPPRGFEQYLVSLGELVWRWQVTQETKRR